MTRSIFNKISDTCGITIISANKKLFHSDHYLRHNARRLEHLASLRIPVANLTVLEVGAGIGDHSHYYLDRGCDLTITEARKDNLKYLKQRYPGIDIRYLDMETPGELYNETFDVVHCYGLLYHLSNPERALEFLSNCCSQILFLETCVSFGEDDEENIVDENKSDPTQAFSGKGCRPTRAYLFRKLQDLFKYVYIPKTQPNHKEFPIDWEESGKHQAKLARSVFVASRKELDNAFLTTDLLNHQKRHE